MINTTSFFNGILFLSKQTAFLFMILRECITNLSLKSSMGSKHSLECSLKSQPIKELIYQQWRQKKGKVTLVQKY